MLYTLPVPLTREAVLRGQDSMGLKANEDK
jgi:hypothetical protein